MNKEMFELKKEMDAATIEMARTGSYPELYQAAKARHTAARRKLIELMGWS